MEVNVTFQKDSLFFFPLLKFEKEGRKERRKRERGGEKERRGKERRGERKKKI